MPDPTKRGLSPEELGVTPSPPVPSEPSKLASDPIVIEVIDFDKATITLKLSDGKTIKRVGGTLAWRNNNPGNLKYGPFAKAHNALTQGAGGHAVFPSKEIGAKAQEDLLFGPERDYANKTIAKAIATYAPTSDGNDPTAYARYVASKVGVPITTVLKTLTEEQRLKMVSAMQFYEGYKEGTTLIL